MNTVIAKSEAWRQQWRSHIGAGRSAAAAGVHEYMSPLELYLSMVEGVDIDPETKPDMLRGILLEPVALQRLQMLYTDLDFQSHNQAVFIYNDKYPWASDLPDFWVSWDGQQIPGQIKVPRARNWEHLDERVPDYIQAACIHSAAMNNAPAILLACLHPENMSLYRQIYEPLPDAIDALMEAESRFMNEHVIPRVHPAPINTEDLKLRWPEAAAGMRLTVTPEIEDTLHKLAGMKIALKHAEEEVDGLSLNVKTFMEDKEAIISESGRVLATWKSHIVNALETKRLKAERPEVWSEFAKDRPVRTFLVKKPKG